MTDNQQESYTMGSMQGKGDGCFIPALDDELTEVQHLLAEPKNENLLENGVFCLDREVCENHVDVGEISCSFNYHVARQGTLRIKSGEEKPESKTRFTGGMLGRVDEEGDHHVTSDPCKDYIFGAGFAFRKPILNDCPSSRHSLGGLGTENQTSVLHKAETSTTEISDLSNAIIPFPGCGSGPDGFILDNMSIHELREAFRSIFGCETTVKNEQWLKHRISFGLESIIDSDKSSNPFEIAPSNENDDRLVFTSNDDCLGGIYCTFASVTGSEILPIERDLRSEMEADKVAHEGGFCESGTMNLQHPTSVEEEREFRTPKRLRKPTKRYIEESSDVKTRHCNSKSGSLSTTSREKYLHIRSYTKGLGVSPIVYKQDFAHESDNHAPCSIRGKRGRPRNTRVIVDKKIQKLDDDYESSNESQDDMSDEGFETTGSGKHGSRRKHHRLWNLTEVMKLVDGVSQYGVGRWTEIKRLLFPSSAYRTSVDLKDKWRNLLKASNTQMQSKEADQRRKHGPQPIPNNILRRVRELSVIYPYPRERNLRVTKPSMNCVKVTGATSIENSVSRSRRMPQRSSS